MKFREVVIKNFMGNIKQYMGLFLCSWFSIALFFSYTTLIFNKAIAENENAWIKYVFPVTMISISLFSIFFIIYANTSFVKTRNKEFGIYLTLGMSHKDLKKIVKIEDFIIFTFSLLMGILTGALFSRLFQMIILNLLDIDNINFYLDYKSFVITALSFIGIFTVVFIMNNRYMNKMDISALLIESRKSEGKDTIKKVDIVLGSIGVILLVLSVISVFIISSSEELNSNFLVIALFTVCLYLSVYLVVSRVGAVIINKLKKTRYYVNNLVSVSEINHKYNQNKRVMFILSILSSVTIFLTASPFSLFNLTEQIAEESKNDLEFVQTQNINCISEEELNNIVYQEDVESYKKVDFVYLNQSGKQVPVIKQSDYIDNTDVDLKLSGKECAVVIVDWTPGNHGYEAGTKVSLNNGSYSLDVTKAGHDEMFIGTSFPSDVILVVNDNQFKNIESNLPKENIGQFHLINYKNWHKIDKIEQELKDKFGDTKYPLFSILSQYKDLKTGYSSFLFVTSVLGILFFIAGGTVLYFRQFMELNNAKVLFGKLYKIGITKKEIKKIVSKELKLVFFVPVIFGIIASLSFIYIITNMVGGSNVLNEFMRNTFIIIIVYIVFQMIFYVLTKIKYVKEIIN